jgi:CO/xanthine dehydrogenase FAD-binding subunit
MIHNHFIPSALSEALNLKNELGDRAFFLGGGTDLFITFWEGKTNPQYLIDLTALPELSDEEKIKGDSLFFGAGLTVNRVAKSALIKKCIPSLFRAASQLGSPAIRNQATIGGNLVNSSPAADLVPPLIAQGALAHTISSNGKRSLPIEKLSAGVNKTVLSPDEILTHISVPILREREGTASLKIGLREALTISVATVSIWIKRTENRKEIEALRIAMGSVAPQVIRASQAEAFLVGGPLKRERVETAANLASQECHPISDIRATSDYRRAMVYELVKAGLRMAWSAGRDKKV